MANAITAHTIVNGPRNLILQFNIVADGSGDYSDFTLLDVDDYLDGPANRKPNNFAVKKVSGRNGTGTSFQLDFGSTTNNHSLFFESTIEDEFEQVWPEALANPVIDKDMTVRITTSGFDASADTISLVIWLKKKFQNSGNS